MIFIPPQLTDDTCLLLPVSSVMWALLAQFCQQAWGSTVTMLQCPSVARIAGVIQRLCSERGAVTPQFAAGFLALIELKAISDGACQQKTYAGTCAQLHGPHLAVSVRFMGEAAASVPVLLVKSVALAGLFSGDVHSCGAHTVPCQSSA